MPSSTPAPHPYDSEVRRMRADKMTTKQIAAALNIDFWKIADSFKRQNLTKPRPLLTKPIRYNDGPLIERRCLACRQLHKTTRRTWVCAPCKEIQERENVSALQDHWL